MKRTANRSPTEALDAQAAAIVRRAIGELTALLPDYVGLDPVRGLRVATAVAESGGDLLREFGVDDDGPGLLRKGKIKSKSGVYVNAPFGGAGIDGMMDAASSQAVAGTVTSLLGAISSAEAAGETELVADLRRALKKARASLTACFGTDEDEGEAPEAPLTAPEAPEAPLAAESYYTPPGGDEVPLASLPNPAA